MSDESIRDDPLLDWEAAPSSLETPEEEPIRRGTTPMAVGPRKGVMYLTIGAAGVLSVILLISSANPEVQPDAAASARTAVDPIPVTPMPEQPRILDQMIAQAEEQARPDPLEILEAAPDSVPQVEVGPGGREYADVGRAAPPEAAPASETGSVEVMTAEREQAYRRALASAAVQETDAARELRQRLQAGANPNVSVASMDRGTSEEVDPLDAARREIEAAEQLLYPAGTPAGSVRSITPLRPQPIPPARPRSNE